MSMHCHGLKVVDECEWIFLSLDPADGTNDDLILRNTPIAPGRLASGDERGIFGNRYAVVHDDNVRLLRSIRESRSELRARSLRDRDVHRARTSERLCRYQVAQVASER